MTFHLNLSPDTERLLQEIAARRGVTLETYLAEIVEREALAGEATFGQGPANLNDFERGLDELSEGLPPLPPLPADFSRADVYGEHP